jgi:hypothetical protein
MNPALNVISEGVTTIKRKRSITTNIVSLSIVLADMKSDETKEHEIKVS